MCKRFSDIGQRAPSGGSTRRQVIGAGAALLAGMTSSVVRAVTPKERTLGLRTLSDRWRAVDRTAMRDLQDNLKGRVLLQEMPEYEAARHIWNTAIDRHPALIIQCVDAHDVAVAIQFAGRHDALVSVRAGGHNSAGFALCDGGMVIDLTRMSQVSVDAGRATARVGGGATFAEYDGATGQFGLASPGPVVSMVGVGGYTLGGGLGWLHRKLGSASDNLLAAQVVTADGKIVQASTHEHADLFWALRGGGGNFGIVTAFDFRLAPVATVLAGTIVHPLEDLPAIAAFVRDFNANAPDDVCIWLMMRKAPASATLPKEIHGRLVATIGICYSGPLENGERVLQPLRSFGRPLVDQIKPRSYVDWQKALDGAWGNGFANRWTGHYLPELTDASAATLLEHVAKISSPFTDVKLVSLGGAWGRVGEDETAFGSRRAKYALVIQARWADVHEPAPHLAWSQNLFDAMKPHSTGKVYVNFVADEGNDRVPDAYGAQSWDRLRAVKATYDPRNVFRMNQNIPPKR
jgi:FAD/FMN-containing dehydrogenase